MARRSSVNYTVADPFQHAADVQAKLDAHAKRLAAPKKRRKASPAVSERTPAPRRPATPIVTEHTRGQATVAPDTRQETGRRGLPADLGVSPKPGLNPQDIQMLGLASLHANPLLQKAAANLIQDAYYTPGGIYAAASAPVSDIAHGRATLPHTRDIAKQIAVGTYETARHPLRRPGDTALLAFAAATAGAAQAAKAGTVGRELAAGNIGKAAKTVVTRQAPGEINLPGGVQALEYDNPLLRPLQRRRLRKVAKAVEDSREVPRGVPSPQGVIGREIRAREQVLTDVAHAPIVALQRMLKRLTPAEHTASRLVAIEGSRALRDPAEVVARHVATHARYVDEARATVAELEAKIAKAEAKGGDAPILKKRLAAAQQEIILNQEVATDIAHPDVLAALQSRSDTPFLRAVAQARKVSRQSAAELYGATDFTAEGGQARLAKIAGIYGNPEGIAGSAPKGSFYFPTGERFKYPAAPPKGGVVASRRPGPQGIPPVTPSRYLGGTLQRFTGRGTRRGVVGRPGEAIATRSVGTARLTAAQRVQEQLISLGTKERVSDRQIKIRTGPITEAERMDVAAALEKAQTGDQTALVRANERIQDALRVPDSEDGVYVDPAFFKEIPTAVTSKVARGAALFNLPFRFTGVYFQPKYILINRPQNIIMRKLMQTGLPRTQLKGRVKSMRAQLGDNVTAVFDGMAGEARTESYNPSRVRGTERKITEWIMEKTDRDERFLATLARAAEKGYKSEQDLRRLALSKDPKVVNDRVAVARRARKDLVDFSITPIEREISDFIYFYPWLSRGSVWSARWLLNRPGQAAFASQLSALGRKRQLDTIGDVPRWLQPYIPIGGRLSNPSSSFTPITPAEIADQLLHPSGGGAHSIAEEFGTPFAQLIGTPVGDLKRQYTSQFGPTSIARTLGLMGSPSKTFPETGVVPAVGRLLGGTVPPRKFNKDAVTQQAAKELPTPQRIKAQWGAKLEKLGITDPDPRITAAIDAAAVRAQERKRQDDTTHGRLKGDLNALVKLRLISPATRAATLREANGMSEYRLAQVVRRADLGNYFDPNGVLPKIDDAVKAQGQ